MNVPYQVEASHLINPELDGNVLCVLLHRHHYSVLVPDTPENQENLAKSMLLVKSQPPTLQVLYGPTSVQFHLITVGAMGNCMFECGAFHRAVYEMDGAEGTLQRTIRLSHAATDKVKAVSSAWAKSKTLTKNACSVGSKHLFDESTAGNTQSTVLKHRNTHKHTHTHTQTHTPFATVYELKNISSTLSTQRTHVYTQVL